MIIPDAPTITLLTEVRPKHTGRVYKIAPPIVLDDGRTAEYVRSSIGSEALLGENNTFAVFASNEQGDVLDWEAIYEECEGPDWCLALMDDLHH